MRTLLFFVAFIVFVNATTLLVPSHYVTIQAAIDSAQSNDVIQISSGTYNEKLRFSPTFSATAVSIVGADPNTTIITNGVWWSFSRQINRLSIRDLQFQGPVSGQDWIFDGNSTFGVSNFILDNCIIDGKSDTQLGLKFPYFDSNFTITNCEFTSLGSTIIETATSETSLESPQSFNQFLIKDSIIRDSIGSINLRGNQSNPTKSFTLQNISFSNIHSDNSSIKAFQVSHVKAFNLLNCVFNNISKLGEVYDVQTAVLANNDFKNHLEGVFFTSGTNSTSCPYVRCNSNTFRSQVGINVNCTPNGPIDLTYNYWGSADGPSQTQIIGLLNMTTAAFPWYLDQVGGKVAKQCSQCANGKCDYATGYCACDNGYSGASCDSIASESKKKGLPAWQAALIALLIIFFFVVIAIVVVIYLKRRSEERDRRETPNLIVQS